MTVLTKEDILSEIEKRTPIGLHILRVETDYYKDLIRDRKEEK